MWRTTIGAVLAVVTAAPAAGQFPLPLGPTVELNPAPINAARVKELVGQLGAADYRTREKAGKALLALGDRALPDLKTALRTIDDEEVHRRLQVIVRKLDADRLGSARRITLTATHKPARAILAEIAKQSGYPIQFTGDGDDKVVFSFDWADVPFWKALDEVCDAAGLTAQQQDEDGTIEIYFTDSYSPHASYHGPFKVLATNINSGRTVPLAGINRKQGNPRQPEYLNLNLSIQSEPKAPLVGVGVPELTKAVDDRGNSLLAPPDPANDPAVTSYYPPQVGFRSFAQGFAVGLFRSDRAATEIRELRGKVPVVVLSEVRPELVIDDLLAVKKKRFAGRTVEVEVIATDYQNDVLNLELTVRQRTGDPEDLGWMVAVYQRLEVLDRDGRKYQFTGQNNVSTEPGTVTMSVQYGPPAGKQLGKPARLQYVDWVTVTKDVEFTFKDIPLP